MPASISQHEISMWQTQNKQNTSYSDHTSVGTPCYRMLQMLKYRASLKGIRKINAREIRPTKHRDVASITDTGLLEPGRTSLYSRPGAVFYHRCPLSASQNKQWMDLCSLLGILYLFFIES